MEVLILICAALALFAALTPFVRRPRPKPQRHPRQATDRQPKNVGVRPSGKAGQPPPFDNSTATAVEDPVEIIGPAYVVDGDSLIIKKTQVRIFGVDAPEMDHPFGKRAKWAMVALCKGQEVRAQVLQEDDHGRTVAKCYLPDGRDLSAELVKQGLALDWPKFSGGAYRHLETPDARRKLWLADARQKGRMDVWDRFEAQQTQRAANTD